MSNDQSKKQAQTSKPGTYTATGFQSAPKPQPKKSITLLDILLGKK